MRTELGGLPSDLFRLFVDLADAVHELSHDIQYERRGRIPDRAAEVARLALVIADAARAGESLS